MAKKDPSPLSIISDTKSFFSFLGTKKSVLHFMDISCDSGGRRRKEVEYTHGGNKWE